MITKRKKQRKLGPLSSAMLSLVLGLLLTGSVTLFNSSPSAAEGNRVTICHHTGSENNPYVVITIDENALPAHLGHGDLYPVPPGGCQTGGTPTQTPTNTPTSTPQPTPTEEGEPDPGLDG